MSDSERELQAMFELAIDAILIADDSGRYVRANPAACALLGVAEQDLLGRGIADFLAPGFEFGDSWRTFFEKGRLSGEVRLVRPDGSILDAEFNAISQVTPGRNLSILRDVTERRRTEEALRRSEQELQLLVRTGQLFAESFDFRTTLGDVARLTVPLLADWCVIDLVSEDGELQRLVTAHADPALQTLVDQLKLHPPTWDSFGAGSVLRSGEPDLIQDITPEVIDRISRNAEHRRIVQALQPRSLLAVPLLARDRQVGAWIFLRSANGQPFGEGDLRLAQTLGRRAALAIDNSRLYLQAESANRSKDQFLASLSHELRTPLTPVLVLVSRLERDGGLSDRLRRDLAVIRKNIELEARLIDDLLDLTRIARGKVELRHEVTDVHVLLGHAIQICGAEAVQAGRLAVETDLRAPDARVWADGSRLTQVFWNLLSNAVKFTPQGGTVRVRTWTEEVDRDAVVADRIVVEVLDTGAGIEPELLPRIFTAFEQGELGRSRGFGGLGLGLAISKAILELHGGSLSVVSEGRGQGATFTARIPFHRELFAAKPVTEGPAPDPVPRSGAGERPLRILLVEDHVDTAEALADLLRDRGYSATVAHSLAEAREAVTGQDGMPETGGFDLVVSDLGLPDGSGLDLMRELSGRFGLRGIALSGYGMEEDVRKSRDAGFSLHLTKPVGLQALEEAIHRVTR